jgi:hypothetical protein
MNDKATSPGDELVKLFQDAKPCACRKIASSDDAEYFFVFAQAANNIENTLQHVGNHAEFEDALARIILMQKSVH